MAFDQSGPRWLGISDLIAEPEGPTFISYKVARSRLDRLRFVTQDPTATLASPPSLLSTKCGSKINPIHMAKERIQLTCMGFRITVVIRAALGFFPQGAASATANIDVTRADDCDKSWIGCGSGNFPPGVAERRLKPDWSRLFQQAVISHGARHGT